MEFFFADDKLQVTHGVGWTFSQNVSSLSSSNGLGFMMLWISGGKGSVTYWINLLITKLFIEQPRLHRVC